MSPKPVNYSELKTQDVIDSVAYYLVNHVMKHYLNVQDRNKRTKLDRLRCSLLTNEFTESNYKLEAFASGEETKEDTEQLYNFGDGLMPISD